MPIGVLGLGSYVPDRVVTNTEVGAWSGVTESWISERTGIEQRRYAADGCATSDLALRAAQEALADLPPARHRLDAIIVATSTPDVPQPATAAILQHKLGIESTPAFDINAVCSGFIYSVALAEGLLGRPQRRGEYVLIIGADKFSAIMERTDRRTVSLFGDGAGAMLLGAVPDGYGFLATSMLTDGCQHGVVGVDGGGTRAPLDAAALARGAHLLRMDGPAVKRWVVPNLRKVIEQALNDSGLAVNEIDRFIFHQANGRLLEAFAAELGVGPDRVPNTAHCYGNTASASVPLTFHAAHRERPLERGERILFAAAGGGLTAAATVLIWH